ncbi:MAG: SDR family NAD(P)-dependent oxidoreductase, partial [Planctomycetia bacterium]|nr:SDR family NAD(P)-dependent oxidoreductase [Planctomycetia bacterium]
AKLMLTGRSAPSQNTEQVLESLRALGAEAEYFVADISERSAVDRLLAHTEQRYGRLDGVIHSAGVLRDSFLLKKMAEECRAVFAPKVRGTTNLDQAIGERALDFFVMFSSGTGSFGNVGQADYALANAFVDGYAQYRHALVESGRRHGRTLSVGWPLWANGGMKMSAAQREHLRAHGLLDLTNERGIEALYQSLASGLPQVQVFSTFKTGSGAAVPGRTFNAVARPPVEVNIAELDKESVTARTLLRLRELLSIVTSLTVEQIDAHEPLESYGIDSIMILQLNEMLGEAFGPLSKTLFFEYRTLAQVCDYLLAEHWPACAGWAGTSEAKAARPANLQDGVANAASATRVARVTPTAREPIAIIGISGRYAQSPDLRTFWENLQAGKDCVAEIPPERWPLEGFYESDSELARTSGRSYSKWGGFIEGFAEFDPLFFNISPRDAMCIDPQEWLFLQSCWHAMEDAG